MNIDDASVEKFPFSIGDRVKIKWAAPREVTDTGKITRLDTSTQWGREVVHCVMVCVDGYKESQAICASILTKINR